MRFTEWREDFHHQHQNVRTENGIEYGDLSKFVDFDYVARVARLNAATLAELASAPLPPELVALQTKELENASTMTWGQPMSGVVGYPEILWRETSSPEWQREQDQRNWCLPVASAFRITCQATLPISKDNVIFAVRSVDQKGHKSLPVVPVPER